MKRVIKNHARDVAAIIVLLVLSGLAAAFVSDWFVHALEPTIKSTGISKPFAGLVIVAIAGNAVEHAVGVVLAHKGQPELAISVVKNSVAQIAAFLYPALVLVSLLTTTHLTFALAPIAIEVLLDARRRRNRLAHLAHDFAGSRFGGFLLHALIPMKLSWRPEEALARRAGTKASASLGSRLAKSAASERSASRAPK